MESMNKQSQDQHRSSNNQQRQAQKCPRCDSTNTKFCYYNNYSLSQPRYFCKTCRRYWTHGGTLRNVPVGGGCRKGSKRAKTSAASPPSASDQYTSPATAMASCNFLSSATGLLSSSFADIQAPFSQPRDHHVLGVSPRASSAAVSDSVSVSSAMMSLLQGLEQGQFYMGSNSSDQPGGAAARPNTAPVSFSSHHDHWPPQSFENMISTSASGTGVWNIDAGDVRAGNTDGASGPSLVPNDMWPDLPRSYGSSPP